MQEEQIPDRDDRFLRRSEKNRNEEDAEKKRQVRQRSRIFLLGFRLRVMRRKAVHRKETSV